MDGYTKPKEYIVTEWPMKHTLGEFWSLVYDHECAAVVVLCNPPKDSVSEYLTRELRMRLSRSKLSNTQDNHI